jgi:hypothetical protein
MFFILPVSFISVVSQFFKHFTKVEKIRTTGPRSTMINLSLQVVYQWLLELTRLHNNNIKGPITWPSCPGYASWLALPSWPASYMYCLLFWHFDYMQSELSRLAGTAAVACRVNSLAGTEMAHTSHVIDFCRVGSAKRAENHTYACFNVDYIHQNDINERFQGLDRKRHNFVRIQTV